MRTPILIAALAAAMALPAAAQGQAAGTASSTPLGGRVAPTAAPEDKKVTLNLKEVPLRNAIDLLFSGTGAQYAVDPGVPNPPISLSIRDVGLPQALRLIIRQASTGAPGLTFNREGDIYVIRMRIVTGNGDEAEGVRVEKVVLNFARADEVAARVNHGLIPGGVTAIEPNKDDNSLLARGDAEGLQSLRNLVRLVDIPSAQFTVRASVRGTGPGGRELALSSMVRALHGTQVRMQEETTVGGQPAHMTVELTPRQQGDGTVVVTSEWRISIPVQGVGGVPTRLNKQLSTETRLRPGQAVALAEVQLPQFGAKGVVRVWLRVDAIPGGAAP